MKKDVSKLLDDINKRFGQGAAIRLGDAPEQVEVVSTGSLALDIALGILGMPKGRIIEIFGPESSGKSTIAIHCIAQFQKEGLAAAFIDAENAFDRTYADALGVSDDLIFSQPSSGEQALEILDMYVKAGIDLVVVDSVAALTPEAEINGEMGDSKMGVQARLMSQAMRKLVGPIKQHGSTVIFINQLREKIGVMFGNPEVTTGGNALKYYTTIRLDVRTVGSEVKDREKIGVARNIKIKVVKNKLAPPGRVAQTAIRYGEGIDIYDELIDLGVDHGVLEKRGSWYGYEGSNLAQGKEAMRQFLVDNEEFFTVIRSKIVDQYFE